MFILYASTKSIEIPEGLDPHEFAASLDFQEYQIIEQPTTNGEIK